MPDCSEPLAAPPPARETGGAPPSHVLVIQLARLGDFLQTTPLLAALRARHPQARLAALVAPAQAPLARACGLLDQVLTLDPASLQRAAQAPGQSRALGRARLRGLTEHLWEFPARQVVNLNLSDLAASLALGWPEAQILGWRWQAGQARPQGEPWAAHVMALVADRRLTRLHLCDILASYAQPAGPPLPRLAYQLATAAKARAAGLLPGRRPRVALQLGANNDLRRWPLESFAQLARLLAEQGASLVILGTGAERGLGQRLGQALGPKAPLCDLMERTDLPGLAGALANCDLVVSADTGTLHLATALGTPCLALYMGPAQAHETGPYGAGHLVLQARDACGPCQEHRPACNGLAPCRRLITPRTAARAALALLGGAEAAQAVAGLELPAGVEALAGVMDGFGQRYRPLTPRPLERLSGLALALREGGRVLLRPEYRPPWPSLRAELAAEHLPPSPQEARALAQLARGAARLPVAVRQGDGQEAGRIGAAWPGLRPLSLLAGPQPPPRLEQACQAALECLELAASLT